MNPPEQKLTGSANRNWDKHGKFCADQAEAGADPPPTLLPEPPAAALLPEPPLLATLVEPAPTAADCEPTCAEPAVAALPDPGAAPADVAPAAGTERAALPAVRGFDRDKVYGVTRRFSLATVMLMMAGTSLIRPE